MKHTNDNVNSTQGDDDWFGNSIDIREKERGQPPPPPLDQVNVSSKHTMVDTLCLSLSLLFDALVRCKTQTRSRHTGIEKLLAPALDDYTFPSHVSRDGLSLFAWSFWWEWELQTNIRERKRKSKKKSDDVVSSPSVSIITLVHVLRGLLSLSLSPFALMLVPIAFLNISSLVSLHFSLSLFFFFIFFVNFFVCPHSLLSNVLACHITLASFGLYVWIFTWAGHAVNMESERDAHYHCLYYHHHQFVSSGPSTLLITLSILSFSFALHKILNFVYATVSRASLVYLSHCVINILCSIV